MNGWIDGRMDGLAGWMMDEQVNEKQKHVSWTYVGEDTWVNGWQSGLAG